MSPNTVTVTIPERLYRRLQWIAEGTNQEIGDVLIASVEAILAVDSTDAVLPPEISDELAAMRLFSDEALWAATEPTLSSEQQARLQELTSKQGEQVLSEAEQEELKNLLAEYDHSVLRRAQALALLSMRGHKLPDLNSTETN